MLTEGLMDAVSEDMQPVVPIKDYLHIRTGMDETELSGRGKKRATIEENYGFGGG